MLGKPQEGARQGKAARENFFDTACFPPNFLRATSALVQQKRATRPRPETTKGIHYGAGGLGGKAYDRCGKPGKTGSWALGRVYSCSVFTARYIRRCWRLWRLQLLFLPFVVNPGWPPYLFSMSGEWPQPGRRMRQGLKCKA